MTTYSPEAKVLKKPDIILQDSPVSNHPARGEQACEDLQAVAEIGRYKRSAGKSVQVRMCSKYLGRR